MNSIWTETALTEEFAQLTGEIKTDVLAEYRLATYLGVRIIACNEQRIVLKQGKLRLEIEIDAGAGHILLAPENGEMVREIRERIVCGARFRFIKDGQLLIDQHTQKTSFECVRG